MLESSGAEHLVERARCVRELVADEPCSTADRLRVLRWLRQADVRDRIEADPSRLLVIHADRRDGDFDAWIAAMIQGRQAWDEYQRQWIWSRGRYNVGPIPTARAVGVRSPASSASHRSDL